MQVVDEVADARTQSPSGALEAVPLPMAHVRLRPAALQVVDRLAEAVDPLHVVGAPLEQLPTRTETRRKRAHACFEY